jgi:hypothetical protein
MQTRTTQDKWDTELVAKISQYLAECVRWQKIIVDTIVNRLCSQTTTDQDKKRTRSMMSIDDIQQYYYAKSVCHEDFLIDFKNKYGASRPERIATLNSIADDVWPKIFQYARTSRELRRACLAQLCAQNKHFWTGKYAYRLVFSPAIIISVKSTRHHKTLAKILAQRHGHLDQETLVRQVKRLLPSISCTTFCQAYARQWGRVLGVKTQESLQQNWHRMPWNLLYSHIRNHIELYCTKKQRVCTLTNDRGHFKGMIMDNFTWQPTDLDLQTFARVVYARIDQLRIEHCPGCQAEDTCPDAAHCGQMGCNTRTCSSYFEEAFREIEVENFLLAYYVAEFAEHLQCAELRTHWPRLKWKFFKNQIYDILVQYRFQKTSITRETQTTTEGARTRSPDQDQDEDDTQPIGDLDDEEETLRATDFLTQMDPMWSAAVTSQI